MLIFSSCPRPQANQGPIGSVAVKHVGAGGHYHWRDLIIPRMWPCIYHFLAVWLKGQGRPARGPQ